MKLFPKLFWSYLTLFLLFALAFFVFTFQNVKKNYQNTSLFYLQEVEKIIDPHVKEFLEKNDREGLRRFVNNQKAGIRLTLIDRQGNVIADSDENPSEMNNHANRPEIIAAFRSGSGEAWRHSPTFNKKMLYYAREITVNNDISYVLRLSFYEHQIDKLQGSIIKDLLQIILGVILVSLVITFLLSRNFIKPITKLADATRQVAAGDFSIRLDNRSHDEIRELSSSFNSMTQQLQEFIEEINSQKEALRNIIDNISELLWVIDAKTEKITLANKAFAKLLDAENSTGKYYWQVIRHLEINEIIKEVIEKRQGVSREITLKEHNLLISVNFLQETDAVIFLLHDFTPLRQLEKVKRDFVTNASHELRTPLASIKGYTELLKESISPENKKILNIIERNTFRLSYLVNDILSLASLEKISSLNLEKTNVSQLLDNSCLLFQPKLKDKNLDIIKDYSEKIYADIDPFRFEQLVDNLIDNAIKYTQAGNITLSLRIETHSLLFKCCDTGIGIPQEVQSRLFERFFVVDKSRSRKFGGTGLGLSIVKHIVQLHLGTIEVESEPGKGSCFIVKIPLQNQV